LPSLLDSVLGSRNLKKTQWAIYAKPPFGGPEAVLKYLARYTHRVAISSSRLLSLDNGRVTFRYRGSKTGNHMKSMTLDAIEFIPRFLLHILPSGFVKIRHFGFLANRNRASALALCRELLTTSSAANDLVTILTREQQRRFVYTSIPQNLRYGSPLTRAKVAVAHHLEAAGSTTRPPSGVGLCIASTSRLKSNVLFPQPGLKAGV
jgi:hypothetical protein